MAPTTAKRVHMDAHRQRTQTLVAPQARESRQPRLPLRTPQTGRTPHQLSFECPIHVTERRKLIGAREDDTWEVLDHQIDIKDEESSREEYYYGVEAFFSYICTYLT